MNRRDDFDRFDAADILPMFAKYHITTFCAPPTMLRMMIKEDLSKYDFSSVKHMSTAGDVLARGAIVVSVHVGVLKEATLPDLLFKGLPVREEVLHPVLLHGAVLFGARRAGGRGDGHAHVRHAPDNFLADGALAHPGWARNNECFSPDQSNSSCVKSSTFIPKRGAIFSVVSAESTTWSLSIISTAAVFRP